MSSTDACATLSYYGNVNPTLLAEVSASAQRVLELGCGAGAMARAVRAQVPEVFYVGLDVAADALAHASDTLDVALLRHLDHVPDWAADAEMAQALPLESFDHLILGDVLEHLYDPEKVLAQAVQRLQPGGRALVCLPNVQHWSVLAQLMLGHWPRTDAGLFDRTHLRWFTLRDMLALLTGCGLVVEKVVPRVFDAQQAQPLLDSLVPALRVLGVDAQQFKQLAVPLQYVLVGRKPMSGPDTAR